MQSVPFDTSTTTNVEPLMTFKSPRQSSFALRMTHIVKTPSMGKVIHALYRFRPGEQDYIFERGCEHKKRDTTRRALSPTKCKEKGPSRSRGPWKDTHGKLVEDLESMTPIRHKDSVKDGCPDWGVSPGVFSEAREREHLRRWRTKSVYNYS